ncbi:hypothetical protein GCM10007898_11230 [Dyella flagellata]|uniref:Uncharacterized protein n=1 Tax=Dyella flagellata TaxID=1867833 RepID=A0ABQ5X9G8_9GAMM|nr:hypothetical protein GCM10007898_11230 [Dyella flagellata]
MALFPLAASSSAFATPGQNCGALEGINIGYIVGIAGPYQAGRPGNTTWDEFGVYLSKKPYYDREAKFFYHDSTDIALTNPLGRALLAQAQLAYSLRSKVQLKSPSYKCAMSGFGTIELWDGTD